MGYGYDYKYRDKNHPPVPMLKVGDIVYAHCQWGVGHNYSEVSKCEIRKVEVRWCEPSDYDKSKGYYGHWYVSYYIRSDIDKVGLKSTKMYSYGTGEDGGKKNLFLTPQEVMDENIREFREHFVKTVNAMRRTMFSLGYTKEMTKKLLEYKVSDE